MKRIRTLESLLWTYKEAEQDYRKAYHRWQVAGSLDAKMDQFDEKLEKVKTAKGDINMWIFKFVNDC